MNQVTDDTCHLHAPVMQRQKHVTDNIIVNMHEIKEIQRFMQCSY